jgi:quercetin dioxygenase-like cupin family protein
VTADEPTEVFFALADVPWADDRAGGAIPSGMLDEADRRGGGGRKLLAAGEGGFHSSYSVVPPGYVMAMHRHDYDELVVVLAGGCRWSDGRALVAEDSVVIPAGVVHGYTCSGEGMRLLTVARGPFRTELVDDGGGAPAG